jgi:hypothetical protein
VYQIKNQTWVEFKDYILSEEAYTDKIIHGTMQGITKPRNMEIKEILINTEHHLEVVMEYGQGLLANSKYYMVKDDNFKMFIESIKSFDVRENNYHCSATECSYRTLAKSSEEADRILNQDGGFDTKKKTMCPKCKKDSLVFVPVSMR